MEVTFRSEPVVMLKLTKEEAIWLRTVMKNPFYCSDICDGSDSIEHDNMRESLFNALNINELKHY